MYRNAKKLPIIHNDSTLNILYKSEKNIVAVSNRVHLRAGDVLGKPVGINQKALGSNSAHRQSNSRVI